MFEDFSIGHANERIKKDTRRMLVVTLLVSFFPLVLGFVGLIINAAAPIPALYPSYPGISKALSAFVSVFLSGDLYFYAMSLCASILVVSQTANQEGNFGMRLWSVVFVLFCAGFMAFFVGGKIETRAALVFHGVMSTLFLIFATLISFRVTVLVDQPPPMPEDVHRQSAEAVTVAAEPDYD